MLRKQVDILADLLSDPINRLSLANKLYSDGLITFDHYKNATDNSSKTDQEKGQSLLNVIISLINTQPHQLKNLAATLKKVEAFKSVAEKLQH